MEDYHRRKKELSNKYKKLINVELQPLENTNNNNDNSNYHKIETITDEKGLEMAYKSKDGLYQHNNKLFIAGTKDFPQDHFDDLKLPFDNTLKLTKRGRDADNYVKSHHEVDTVIGHSLGGAVALSIEKKYRYDKDKNPYGIRQSKTFGAPTVSGNIENKVLKGFTQQLISDGGTAAGTSLGASISTSLGGEDAGLATVYGAKKGGEIASDFSNRITNDTNINPDRVRRFGDPVSIFDRNAKTVYTGTGFNPLKNHSYRGLSIDDKVLEHETERNPLSIQDDDKNAVQITQ